MASPTLAGDGAGGAGGGAGAWVVLDPSTAAGLMDGGGTAFIRCKPGQGLVWDRAAMEKALAAAPMEFTPEAAHPVEIVIPTPTGRMARYGAVESPVMAAELRATHPEIRTYWARGIDDPTAVARFDVTPLGFRAMVRAPEDSWTGGTYLIDPANLGDDAVCTSYYWRDYAPADEAGGFVCHTVDAGDAAAGGRLGDRGGPTARSGATLRTYRLAMATTGEFTAFYGSSATALAGVVTIANRISGIYEDDLAVRLELVANNLAIVYPSAATDPFTAPGTAGTTNSQLQTALDSTIGTANYDVGHVLHRGTNNGLAGAIGNICVAGAKGQGYTSTDPPTGDVIAVDYAAHELGHQFGARHTFNNCAGGAGDSAALAYEPGSGVTIMAYAGICGTTNIAAHSDPDFHGANIDQIQTYLSGAGDPCAVKTATGNLPPVVTVTKRTYNVPVSTPFVLTCAATDPDGDGLTYDWEQIDGSVSTAAIPLPSTLTSGPTFRSYPASASPARSFQRLEDLVLNTFSPGDQLPSVARTMNFRCTVRDGRGGVADTANGAGGAGNEIAVVTSGTQPFKVTSPNTAVFWVGSKTVTWNVSGTNVSPISCATVNILLSTDGGLTYPYTLASGVPNSGSAVVTIPAVPTTAARVRVEAADNIFFDISDANFAIPGPGVDMRTTGLTTVTDSAGFGNSNAVAEPGESPIGLFVEATNAGGSLATGITATLESLTSNVMVLSGGLPGEAVAYPDVTTGGTAYNLTPFTISVSSSAVCGSLQPMRMHFAGPGGASWTQDFTIKMGVGGTDIATNVSYSGPAVAIPEYNTANGTLGANVNVNVSGLSGTITGVRFRFDGATCSSAIGATTVGLDHTFMGDLVITLKSPAGTVVTLMNREGSSGNNLCQSVFEDVSTRAISTATSSQQPFTGSWKPESPLSALNGQNPNGVWSLKVVDQGPGDTGNVRAFTLLLTTTGAPVCAPPKACACAADFDGSGGTPDAGDIDAFFEQWLAGDAAADTDCSGGTPDASDIDTFFAEWLAGGC